MSLLHLTADQELEAKHLEAKINFAIAKEVADLARLLVSKGDKDLFAATEDLITLAGTTGESFQEAAQKLLPKMAAVRQSESAVRRTSEAAGKRLRASLQNQKVLGGPTPWAWHKDARGKTCAYISIDAT